MALDNSWTNNPIDFKFLTCSGAKLISAAKGDDELPVFEGPQMDQIGNPNLLAMQLGDNNAHFSDIAKSCIYLGSGNHKQYPDPDSDCTKQIEQWEPYVSSNDTSGTFKSDHHQTLLDIIDHPAFKGREDVYLYIIDYAQFFNINLQIATSR
jgi:hypothetical protein